MTTFCKAQQIREKMSRGETVIGAHTFYLDPSITEALGLHGFEFVWIDGEHSAFDKASTLSHIMAAAAADTASIVRVPWNDPVLVKPILEMGPDGILFPMVCTAEEAKKAVAACMYPPQGVRGFGPRRANKYGAMSNEEFLDHPEKSFLRIVQIEHVDAVRNLREILDVEGIDLPLIGANDLSASIGHLGHTAHPEVRALCEEAIAICKEMNRPFGVSLGAGDHEAISYWLSKGVSFMGCGDDISYISMGCQATMEFVKDCMDGKQ
ncbi:MAG: 4-hydroxy-3-methylbut-2-en-1-yl diphosphate synthase [Lachnospiraceae bacterium]|nr:4-hydroxy-3-methylbut-2-en-1-yl diphosphate synthase [Lachnospiraceae bacterium]MCI8996158.1 4-hydroxy-3-methylbut-2-en-1-yl diphosphate synthase [Lachnospiraceae bacterium]MCI9134614.1 4-hydroxy-3-methylbut-2-en-1-yl diphosphate synthase [Lachnospiraceae bacterium]